MELVRYKSNPIITPSNNWWETQAIFNTGATWFDGRILLLYRAIGGDGLSRFGLAVSSDGLNFERFDTPILEADPNNPEERLGIEDPRITKIDSTYYIIYTAASVYEAEAFKTKKFAPAISHPAPWKIRPSLMITKDFKSFERKGVLLDIETKDAVLFPEKIAGRFVMLHRVYPKIQITFSHDLVAWHDESVLISPRTDYWDSERVGAGPPPIKTEQGWFALYHGVNQEHRYMLGLLLLDLSDPTKVLYRSEKPILEPTEDYERVGATPNVVFTCGAIEKGDSILVYYGAADKVIGLATLDKTSLPF